MELEGDPEKVVDLETGDIYQWDHDLGYFVKVEPEVEVMTEYVGIQVDPDNSELSVFEDSLEDLEMEVNDLSDQIDLMAAYDAAADQNLGTSNVSIFSGLVSKVPFGQHYVYWRDGQTSYKFAYGDIFLSGSSFMSDGSVVICSYDTNTTGYNTNYTWTSSVDNNFSLQAGNRLVYSDLGDYPGLAEREALKYEAIQAFSIFGFVLFCLFDRIRCSCVRG